LEMRKLRLLVSLATIGFALAGCAGASGRQTVTTNASDKSRARSSPIYPSRPRSVHIVNLSREKMHNLKLQGHGAGFVSQTRLAFETSGSSNCRGVPATLAVTSPDAIRVRLKEEQPASGYCLTDLVIEPVVIAISPQQINVHHQLTVRLYYPRTKHPVVFTAAPLS
jgi:hypothetical protein